MALNIGSHKYGVEIECEGAGHTACFQAVRSALGPQVRAGFDHNVILDAQGRPWRVKGDGSLDCTGVEVVTPPITLADMPTLRAVLTALQEAGAHTRSGRCGTHVHVDATHFDPRTLANLCTLVYRHEAHIYKALDITETRALNYTRPHYEYAVQAVRKEAGKKTATTASVAEAWYDDTGSRYYGLNLCAYRRHGTVEFRYFNGTLDPDQVEAYVTLVLALAQCALTKRSVSHKGQKPLVEACARFDMRVWLVHLGLNGKEFKQVRKVLTRNVGGNNRRAVGRTCTAQEAYESLPTVRAARAAEDAARNARATAE